jgi:hypothetical protein
MTTSILSRRARRVGFSALIVGAMGLFAAGASTQAPHFYPDDPIAREPESQDASKAAPYEQSQMYELLYNLFVTSGYKPSGLRAKNVNSIDEVPDSGWFTNRIGTRPITNEELVRGPNVGPPPDPSKWVLIREKTSGAHPGFTATDARGETWFLEFDPPYYPEAATAAVAIATKIFWALGYNQVESFLTTFDPKKTTIDPKATVRRPNGKRTPFTHDDINVILEKVARNADGTYRVIAGRLLPGKILGAFQYAGTRPDDPNDLVPHEHRRELRALRVFGAWTSLTDLKSANTLDTLVSENGKMVVRHYLQDVGSTFGMSNDLHEWDLGYEYFYEGAPSRKRLFTLGFGLSPWQTVHYVEYPSVGKFEGTVFDPRKWRPQTPTTAYMELREDDAFWAARRVAAFSDDMIRTVVHTGQFSDPAAEKYLADVVMQRRDKIKSVYLTAVNPIVDPRLDAKGLTFGNAAVDGGVAQGPVTYRASWMTFDNATGATTPLSETKSETTTIAPPADLPSSGFVAVDIAADSQAYPTWKQPVRAYFRRDGSDWKLVGFQRMPDKVGAAAAPQTASR